MSTSLRISIFDLVASLSTHITAIVLLLSSGEGEIDLLECWVQNFARELLQVAVEGMGVE